MTINALRFFFRKTRFAFARTYTWTYVPNAYNCETKSKRKPRVNSTTISFHLVGVLMPSTCRTNVLNERVEQSCRTNLLNERVERSCRTNLLNERVERSCPKNDRPLGILPTPPPVSPVISNGSKSNPFQEKGEEK